jgi:Kef-type K+ transport system membrane component KefB
MPALAAADGSRAVSQVLFIAELALLLVVGRLMGEAALRLGQPSVMGQLISVHLLRNLTSRLPTPNYEDTTRGQCVGSAVVSTSIRNRLVGRAFAPLGRCGR